MLFGIRCCFLRIGLLMLFLAVVLFFVLLVLGILRLFVRRSRRPDSFRISPLSVLWRRILSIFRFGSVLFLLCMLLCLFRMVLSAVHPLLGCSCCLFRRIFLLRCSVFLGRCRCSLLLLGSLFRIRRYRCLCRVLLALLVFLLFLLVLSVLFVPVLLFLLALVLSLLLSVLGIRILRLFLRRSHRLCCFRIVLFQAILLLCILPIVRSCRFVFRIGMLLYLLFRIVVLLRLCMRILRLFLRCSCCLFRRRFLVVVLLLYILSMFLVGRFLLRTCILLSRLFRIVLSVLRLSGSCSCRLFRCILLLLLG